MNERTMRIPHLKIQKEWWDKTSGMRDDVLRQSIRSSQQKVTTIDTCWIQTLIKRPLITNLGDIQVRQFTFCLLQNSVSAKKTCGSIFCQENVFIPVQQGERRCQSHLQPPQHLQSDTQKFESSKVTSRQYLEVHICMTYMYLY